MGLWQNLCAAYTANEKELSKTFPLSATTINNSSSPLLVVTLDADGNLKRLREIPKRSKTVPLQTIVIPVTEESQGRVGVLPHPLFDQYAYLKGDGDRFAAYLSSLEKLRMVAPAFESVYRYAARRTLAEDVAKVNIAPGDKEMVLFELERPGEPASKLWEDADLMAAWHRHYVATKQSAAEGVQELEAEVREIEDGLTRLPKAQHKALKQKKREIAEQLKKRIDGTVFCDDMITGERTLGAISHPKKVVNAAGNAKLISDNDTQNFTFRGCFATSREAFAVGYDSSQRAHQFLRYLVNTRGISCESQVIVSFTTASAAADASVPLPPPPVTDDEEDWDLDAGVDVPDAKEDAERLALETGVNFAEALRKAMLGYKADSILSQRLHDPTAIVILDAATTGRLSVTFYREMTREDYLERLLAWHEDCRWILSYYRKGETNDEKGQRIAYVGAPSVDSINVAVNGLSHGDSGYNRLKKQTREVLMRCIFDNTPFPRNYLVQAVRRASSPLANATVNGKFRRDLFLQNLAVVCALVNKSLKDERKETCKMSIDPTRCDRDYLYGRLLGAADKLEEYALFKKGNKRVETAAIRYMQTFSQRPFSTWTTIHDALVPYIQQVKNSFAFAEIQQVKNQFKSGEYENDAPLNGSYLLGYYCERTRIEQLVSEASSKNNKTETEE